MKNNKSLITYSDPKSSAAEAYRMLRTNLHYLNIDKENRVIMVTSSNMAEGKTTTICNLAVTMAQSNKDVLLLECDLRKPRIHRVFNIDNSIGLTNVITENKTLDEVVKSSPEYSNLSIVTCGPIPPDPAEILQSISMRNFIEQIKSEFDIVLIDVPPVCSVADASILGGIVDGVIFVISSQETNVESAKTAVKTLEKVGANILGAVLVKVKLSRRGYYYYYNYYSEDENTTKKKRKKHRKKTTDD